MPPRSYTLTRGDESAMNRAANLQDHRDRRQVESSISPTAVFMSIDPQVRSRSEQTIPQRLWA
jgi:hypothetical protein